MSTDTAFALGAARAAAPRGATRLRVFLLTLAVVDDLVRAARDRHRLQRARLVRRAGGRHRAVRRAHRACATRRSGAGRGGRRRHRASGSRCSSRASTRSIAGLAIGLVTSAYPPARSDLERATRDAARSASSRRPSWRARAQLALTSAISPNERLQYRLHPWTSYVIVPLFALANAGITFTGGAARRRAPLADHARHRGRLRRRQAARDPRRARGWRPAACSAACGLPVSWPALAGRRRRAPASASPSRC